MREVRDYIKNQIRKIDARILEHEGLDEPPATRIESIYRLGFGEVSSANEASHFSDTQPVEITLYRRNDKQRLNNYDACVDLIKKIRSVLAGPANFSGTVIASIGQGSFAVTEWSNNKDIYELRLSLDFVVNSAL